MSFQFQALAWARIAGLGLWATAGLVSGCGSPSATGGATHESPAKVEVVPHETELATVTLTADAVARLGISTEVVQREEVAQHRTFASEAMVPSGRSIIVSAPVPGVLSATAEGGFPLPGARVDVTQTVMVLRPLLSPERDVPTPAEQVQMTGARANLIAALVTAEGEVQRSQSEVDGLLIALDRAEKLYADRAGSRRAVDDAEAQLNIANSVLTAARERAQQLADLVESLKSDDPETPPSPLLLKAPVKGIVRSVSVSAGQTVTAGAPLFEVVNLDKIWVRVPVYVDLLGTLAWTEPARLVALDGGPLEPPAAKREATSTNPGPTGPPLAMPIAAPPTADAASSSADLYYEVDNRDLGLRPRCSTHLRLLSHRDFSPVDVAG